MDNLLNDNRLSSAIGNWNWQPQKLKEQFGQLTLSDVTIQLGKEYDMLFRIGIRLNKTQLEVVNILKKLKPF